MPLIVGIDPGSYVTGFGVIEAHGDRFFHVNHGVILLEKSSSFSQRLFELSESLKEVFLKYRPEQIVVEEIFLGRNTDSAFKLGHARGVVLCEAMRTKAVIYEYATRSVKKGVTGKGGATKEEVQHTLKRLLNLKAISRLDASDALALAVHHAFRLQIASQWDKAIDI